MKTKYEVTTGKALQGRVLLQFDWVKILAHTKEVFSLGQGQQIIAVLRVLLASLCNTQTRQARSGSRSNLLPNRDILYPHWESASDRRNLVPRCLYPDSLTHL